MAELFVHDRLAGPEVRVAYEENGTGPDFRVYTRHDEQYLAAIEVFSLLDNPAWTRDRLRHDRIADDLNKRIPLDRWFARFEVVSCDRQPSVKRLAAWVRQTIDALPPAHLHGPTFTPPISYHEDGVELRFQFLPRASTRPPGPGERIVAFGHGYLGFVDSYQRMRDALAKKVQKGYDARGKPLALLAVDEDFASGIDQYLDALYGNEQVAAHAGTVHRANNGFFGTRPDRPDGNHVDVSCVFVLSDLRPWSPTTARLLRFDNPFAAALFPDTVLPADHTFVASKANGGFRLQWQPTPPAGHAP